jgi:hemoglobin
MQPQQTPYELVGGEAGLRALVDRFYHHMDTLPEAAVIRAMHAPDLAEANEKLFLFLSGRFGGPNLYIERYGHPRLRGRHMPFSIGTDDAKAWVLCMDRALDDVVEDPQVRQGLHDFFEQVAMFMRNRPD